MIDVLADDDRRGFGITAALALQGIPHRRIARADQFDADALILSRHAPDADATALAMRVPAVVLGAPAALLEAAFAVSSVRLAEGPRTVPLDGPLFPEGVRATARRFGADPLRLPRAPLAIPAAAPSGTVLARADGGAAVVARGCCVWALLDVGTALADLMDEAHVAAPPARATPGFLRPALSLYYRAPEALRRRVQRRTYRRLARRLGPTASRYPVDATGWLLLELVTGLVRHAAGRVVRVAPWPAPHGAAAILSHDVEPTSFAYGPGLAELLQRVAASGHPATFGLVAGPASRALTPATISRLRAADVLCHGLEHRGETIVGTREAIAAGLSRARTTLEECLGRPVGGFRSPRLDRSSDLLWALDHSGFTHDSSFPDVDRENLGRFGAGVRVTVPYRPPIAEDGGRVRASRCLELPVSAPDCIQPLFAGDDEAALQDAVRGKVDFIRATGGLYTGIVHGGVFGPADAARRGAHLAFVRDALAHADVWLASAGGVADWWRRREAVRLHVRGDAIEAENAGPSPVSGLRVLVERDGRIDAHVLPPLAPGARVAVGGATPQEAACR